MNHTEGRGHRPRWLGTLGPVLIFRIAAAVMARRPTAPAFLPSGQSPSEADRAPGTSRHPTGPGRRSGILPAREVSHAIPTQTGYSSHLSPSGQKRKAHSGAIGLALPGGRSAIIPGNSRPIGRTPPQTNRTGLPARQSRTSSPAGSRPGRPASGVAVAAGVHSPGRWGGLCRRVRRRHPLYLALLAVLFFGFLLMRSDYYLLRPYIRTVRPLPHRPLAVSYDADSGLYTLTASGDDFRVLQLTDIHLGGGPFSRRKDLMALRTCEALIRRTLPDLVVVTGDMAFPLGMMSGSLNNKTPFVQFEEFMERLGIPWAFTYGNHDTEFPATLGPEKTARLLRSLSCLRGGQLLYPDIKDTLPGRPTDSFPSTGTTMPENGSPAQNPCPPAGYWLLRQTGITAETRQPIAGRCNQALALRRPDGSLWQMLYLIDSNDYLSRLGINRYDYIRDDQVDWYIRSVLQTCRQEGRTVPSLIFTHIPLREYRTAHQLWAAGDRTVIYHDGLLGEARSHKISCSSRQSRLFAAAVTLGSTRGIFCGHDHYNNLSLTYRGIRLTFGRSIDYLAMPGISRRSLQRGATLITLHGDESFSVTSCPAIPSPLFRPGHRNTAP